MQIKMNNNFLKKREKKTDTLMSHYKEWFVKIFKKNNKLDMKST